jgi:hypothetical protein
VHVVAGMGNRQGVAGLDHRCQIEALDMLHCQDEALSHWPRTHNLERPVV